MTLALIIGSVVLPLCMVYLRYRSRKWHTGFNSLMVIAVLLFGNIASVSIYQIIKHHTVFMTTIHAVFLNPIFLVSAAYIGLYVTYQLLWLTMMEW